MSRIVRLNVSSVRNINSCEMRPSSSVNVFYGKNGSGKTSLLEAVHILASGKSFRSIKVDPLINHEASEAIIYAELANGYHIGLSKSRREIHQLLFQNQPQRNWETIARELPIQLLDSNSFLLLEGGPRSRRKYLDWGAFHVEQNFLQSWRRTKKCLANRNVLLKQRKIDTGELLAWDAEFSEAASEVDQSRSRYLQLLAPRFGTVYRELEGAFAEALELKYHRGWQEGEPLADVLRASIALDSKYGATQSGPHRAELDIRIGRNRAVDILSRGQQKVLVSALKIAQGDILSSALGRNCIYLVDDLAAELDVHNRAAVLSQLLRQGGQLFLTCVEKDALDSSLPKSSEMAMFHVEHGTITT